ncbi:hypothetical protein JTE90_025092 [Oedothorax gibbosus]|uniref:Uncharacterized protein n=1 Tax=Oedothorax gibbosus TaxID=931172 RepID=A0AAV6U263_9ARAC|nr:hypothetical protein JTE90_025092 [Oedothorax gibbosus]
MRHHVHLTNSAACPDAMTQGRHDARSHPDSLAAATTDKTKPWTVAARGHWQLCMGEASRSNSLTTLIWMQGVRHWETELLQRKREDKRT